MSRVGKAAVVLPAGVTVKMSGTVLEVSGPKGKLLRESYGRIKLASSGNTVTVQAEGTENTSSYWGLYRTLLSNMVLGVSSGYSKILEIQGTGYRASMKGASLTLNVGFSHAVNIDPPVGISFEVDKTGRVIVSGTDKELVGQMSAKIRSVRPAEPYQGKGVRYSGEVIKLKVGKSASKK